MSSNVETDAPRMRQLENGTIQVAKIRQWPFGTYGLATYRIWETVPIVPHDSPLEELIAQNNSKPQNVGH